MRRRHPAQLSLLDTLENARRATAPFKRGDLVGAQDLRGRIVAGIIVYLNPDGWYLHHAERRNPPPYYMLYRLYDSAGPAVAYMTLRESDLTLVRPGRDELLKQFARPDGHSFGYDWCGYAAALMSKGERG